MSAVNLSEHVNDVASDPGNAAHVSIAELERVFFKVERTLITVRRFTSEERLIGFARKSSGAP
jgi:hypothetical protein